MTLTTFLPTAQALLSWRGHAPIGSSTRTILGTLLDLLAFWYPTHLWLSPAGDAVPMTRLSRSPRYGRCTEVEASPLTDLRNSETPDQYPRSAQTWIPTRQIRSTPERQVGPPADVHYEYERLYEWRRVDDRGCSSDDRQDRPLRSSATSLGGPLSDLDRGQRPACPSRCSYQRSKSKPFSTPAWFQ